MSKTMDVTEIPEVLEFMNAKEELESFMARNSDLMDEFRQLSEVYNTTRQSAEKKVRGLDVTCGPFNRYQVNTKYDVEKLYSAIGRKDFLRIGGVVKTITEYGMDKKSIEAAIAREDIPEEVINAVRSYEPRYKVPEKVTLP